MTHVTHVQFLATAEKILFEVCKDKFTTAGIFTKLGLDESRI